MNTISNIAPEGASNPSCEAINSLTPNPSPLTLKEMPTSTSPVVMPTGEESLTSHPSPITPMMTLESVCHYACHISDDHEATVITHMMMAQYMQQGLQNPELTQLILGIPERRKQIQREEEYKRLHPGGTLNTSQLPPALRTPAAIQIWQTLFTESLVDEECQTLCSRTESGLMAAQIAKALGIRNVWVTFEELWGIRNLKSARDKAFDYQNGWNFQKKLDTLIPC